MNGENNVFVRAAEQKDLSDVVMLINVINKTNYSVKEYSSIWSEYFKQKFNYSAVALFNQKVVGFGAIVISKRLRGGHLGVLEDIIVTPNFRRQGIGKTIVDFLFDIAKTQGCYKVALSCKDHNVEFYEICGYEVSGVAMQRFLK